MSDVNNQESVTWYELTWMFFRHVETDIEKIKETMNTAIDGQDRPVQFRFEKRVSSTNAYNRAFKEQNRFK